MMHGTPARVLAQHLGRNLRFSGSRPPARGARPLPLGSVPGAAGEVGSTTGCVAMQFVRSVRRSIGRVIGGDPFGARVAASTSLQGGGMGGSRTGSLRVGRARKFSISETFSATMRSPDLLRHVEAGAARSALPSANRMGSAACVRYLDRRL